MCVHRIDLSTVFPCHGTFQPPRSSPDPATTTAPNLVKQATALMLSNKMLLRRRAFCMRGKQFRMIQCRSFAQALPERSLFNQPISRDRAAVRKRGRRILFFGTQQSDCFFESRTPNRRSASLSPRDSRGPIFLAVYPSCHTFQPPRSPPSATTEDDDCSSPNKERRLSTLWPILWLGRLAALLAEPASPPMAMAFFFCPLTAVEPPPLPPLAGASSGDSSNAGRRDASAFIPPVIKS